MSFILTYDAIAKRIDHSLLGPTLDASRARGRLPAGGPVRRGQRLHQAVRRRAGRADPRRVPGSRSARRSASRTAVMPRRSRSSKSQQAMADGATELDMVINIGQAIGGDWDAVASDIAAVTKAAHDGGAIVKVIFENCYLNDDQKIRLCQICGEVGADYVKTSTGYGTGGATVDDLRS